MTRNAKVQIAGRLSYREAIEDHYARHPTATMRQVREATGAPGSAVRTIYARLIATRRLVRNQPDHFSAV